MGVIQIENLVKKYGANVAVDGLNLDIEGGKVYGFLGPNGAGKSTTMNIITGYIGATSGTVKVGGFDIFTESKKAKSKVGYLPEQPPLYQELTVDEYLRFVAELKKIPKKLRKEAISIVVEKTGIQDVQNRLIKNLSKGYKQRVGIAQAIIDMPDIIILDEPTVGLDPNQIVEIRNLIKSLGEQHTVILSSHILTEVSEVCDYIYIINNGQLVAEGTEEELTKDIQGLRKLEQLFIQLTMNEPVVDDYNAAVPNNDEGSAEVFVEEVVTENGSVVEETERVVIQKEPVVLEETQDKEEEVDEDVSDL